MMHKCCRTVDDAMPTQSTRLAQKVYPYYAGVAGAPSILWGKGNIALNRASHVVRIPCILGVVHRGS